MNIKWTIVTAWIALTVVLVTALPALADGPGAVAWLVAQQNADGGFGAPASTMGATADVLLAAATTGENGLDWAQAGGATARSFLEANAAAVVKAGEAAKVILSLVASGVDPRDLGGVDLVAKLEGMVGDDGRIGGEGEFINEHCYGMIALSSVRRPVPTQAVSYLLDRQIADGTWSWNGGTDEGSGDNNTAAMAVVALIAAGVPADHAQVQKTIQFFQGQQNEDGGFPYVKPSPYGTNSDANSTAVVMWALLAAGEDPAGVDWKFQGQDGHSALDRLRAFQNESGAFRWQDAVPADGAPDDNFAATVQAAVALELKTLPLATMNVGEAAAGTAVAAAPEVLPETGADLWVQVFALLGGGVALMGAGLLLRRRA
jgi:LPXTG-motif cell wall-anchored protein